MIIKPDEIIRSRRKTVSLTVDSSGRLIVRAPLRCSEARILAFIEKKSDWILKHKSKRTVSPELFPSENLDGFRFSLTGGVCEIKLYEGKKVVHDETIGILHVPKDKAEECVRKWLKIKAKSFLEPLVAARARQMGATYKSVSISSAKGRWGSCSSDDVLRFTFRLLYAPVPVIDYVIVHELAHVFHKNHGKEFWARVEKYCPDWKTKRKWLKDHGYFMKIF